MSFEAREHVRYKMKDGILAALPVPGTLKVIIGRIIDISVNGLALSHEDEIATSLNGAELVLMGREQFDKPVFEVPARLVYERILGEIIDPVFSLVLYHIVRHVDLPLSLNATSNQ